MFGRKEGIKTTLKNRQEDKVNCAIIIKVHLYYEQKEQPQDNRNKD